MPRVLSSMLVLCFAWGALAAQGDAGGPIGKVYLVKPKPGMQMAFEEAYKEHMGWHRSNNDTWSWWTYQVVNGEQLGWYQVVTIDHSLGDFDAHAEASQRDAAHFWENVGQTVEEVRSYMLALRPDLSRMPAERTPKPLIWGYEFQLKPGTGEDFAAGVKRIHEALSKAEWNSYVWYQRINGGPMPHFTVILPRDNWAGFQPPSPDMGEVMRKHYGHTEAGMIRNRIDDSAQSVTTWVAAYREDLSYIPE